MEQNWGRWLIDENRMMVADGTDNATYPELMTQAEVIRYLRIPEVSKANDYSNVIENLQRMHDLPCIHIAKQPLYPLAAVRRWVEEKLSREQK